MTDRSYPNYPFDRDPINTLKALISQADNTELSLSWYANRLAEAFLFSRSPAGAEFWHDIVYDLRAADADEGAAGWALYRAKIELISWLQAVEESNSAK